MMQTASCGTAGRTRMYRLGFDIGGTHIACGIINDETFEIVGKDACAFFRGQSAEKTAQCMAELAKNTAARCGTDFQQIETVGVCIPGSIDAKNGTVVNAYNLGFHNVPFRQIVKETFNKPAAMLNDADAAALAEHRLGVLRGTRNSLLVTLGTGFGGGIILNGEIFCGGRGFGVELGHIQMDMHGEKCTCGRRGCIETLCAASRLTRDALRLAEKKKQAGDKLGETLHDAGTLIAAARAGDIECTEAWNRYLDDLSNALVSLINILDPEIIAVGGGVSGAGDFLIVPLNERVAKGSFFKKPTPVVKALLGNDAGIAGAALFGAETAPHR